MRTLALSLPFLIIFQSAFAGVQKLSIKEKIEIAKTRCAPPKDKEIFFFMDIFKHNASLKEIDELYKTVYTQKERLFNRATFNQNSQFFSTSNGRITVTLPIKFLESLTLHIENALKENYVKYIFFSDMGHSHLLIPNDYYNEHLKEKSFGAPPNVLNHLLKIEGLKSLYHTAEHFKLTEKGIPIQDEYLKWRFYTRNPVMDQYGKIKILNNPESPKNTVGRVEGYHWSFGINISANQNGCFPFEDSSGQIQYFDVSAWDPPYDCVNNFCGRLKYRNL